jgi:hypothetical protein
MLKLGTKATSIRIGIQKKKKDGTLRQNVP